MNKVEIDNLVWDSDRTSEALIINKLESYNYEN